MSSAGSVHSEEGPGSRLRRLAQELLAPEERLVLRKLMRQYRETESLGNFVVDLSRLVVTYERLPLIDAIAAVFPDTCGPHDEQSPREDFLAKVSVAIPLFASTRKLSMATTGRQRSVSMAGIRPKSVLKERTLTRARSSDRVVTLVEPVPEPKVESENPPPPPPYPPCGLRNGRRQQSQAVAKESDNEVMQLARRMQEEKTRHRPRLGNLVDKGFWSSERESAEDAEVEVEAEADRGRRKRRISRQNHHRDRLKANSVQALPQADSSEVDVAESVEDRPSWKSSYQKPRPMRHTHLRHHQLSASVERVPTHAAEDQEEWPSVPQQYLLKLGNGEARNGVRSCGVQVSPMTVSAGVQTGRRK